LAYGHALRCGCVSCHTGLPYLLSRPALRHAMGEKTGPTLYESVLVDSMRATVIRTDANDLFAGLKGVIVDQVYGAQVVLSSLVLAMDDAPRGKLSPEGEKAFDRMWSLQLKSGADKGAWLWSDFDLDLGRPRTQRSMAPRWGPWLPAWLWRTIKLARRSGRTWPLLKPICARGKRPNRCITGCSAVGVIEAARFVAGRRSAGDPG